MPVIGRRVINFTESVEEVLEDCPIKDLSRRINRIVYRYGFMIAEAVPRFTVNEWLILCQGGLKEVLEGKESEFTIRCRRLSFAEIYAVEEVCRKFQTARAKWIKGGSAGVWSDEERLKAAWAKIK